MSLNDLYNRIVSGRGSVEKVFERLPGFRGYMEMSARRQADRMIREQVAGRLRQQVSRLAQIEKALLDAGGLSHMSKTRSAKTKLQTFIDRVATDTPGYSGFFDSIKVGPEDLQVIYSFDEALLDYDVKFTEKLDALQAAVGNEEAVDQAITDLDALAVEANNAYSLRENVLKGLE